MAIRQLHLQEPVEIKFVLGNDAALNERRNLLILARRFDRTDMGGRASAVGNQGRTPRRTA